MKIRTLIVDDEPVARRGLEKRLQNEDDFEIIGMCEDGVEAIAAITEHKPDLVFLDIQMPELTGFDVIDAIGFDHMPAIIFVTAFNQFAVQAFDVRAVDYLLKPIETDRFQLALNRVREGYGPPDDKLKARITSVLKDLGIEEPKRWTKRLAIKENGRVLLVDVQQVERVEAAGNYAEIYSDMKMHLLRETLTSLEGRLDPDGFVRVSRSAIINIAYVRELQPMFNGDFIAVMKNGVEVNGSRRYRERLANLLS